MFRLLSLVVLSLLAALPARADVVHAYRPDGQWADVVARGPGFAWVYAKPGAVVFEGVAVVPVPTDLVRYLDAELVNGTVYAIGQGGEGAAWLVSETGGVANLGLTHGVNPVALSGDGEGVLAWVMRAPDRVDVLRADASFVGQFTTRPTSQGIRQILDGQIVLADDTYAGAIEGYALWQFSQAGGRTAGQRDDGVGLFLSRQPVHFVTVRRGPIAHGVHLAVNGAQVAVTALTERGAWLAILSPPYPPHEPRETPPPKPEVCGNGVDDDGDGQVDEGCPVEPKPQPLPDHAQVVRDVDAAHPHLLRQNTAETVREFYWRAAVALHARDPRWGMLTKSAGETHQIINGERVALDAVTYRDTDQVVDIMKSAGDGPGTGGVSWDVKGRRPSNLWLAPPPFAGTTDPPPPTCQRCQDDLARALATITAIGLERDQALERVRQVESQLKALDELHAATLLELDRTRVERDKALAVSCRVVGGWGPFRGRCELVR